MLIPWTEIETVLLDMDGTLLDLYFDNYFWLEYVPLKYAEQNALLAGEGKAKVLAMYQTQQGTLNWYCIDFWTEKLNLPLLTMKYGLSHLIQWRDQAEFFLKTLKDLGKEVVLITNAHPDSLTLKMQRVMLKPWFDEIISSHAYGYPKENLLFWKQLQEKIDFDAKHTLFIDDSFTVLSTAKQFAIKHLYGIAKPDSRKAPIEVASEFDLITSYASCFTSHAHKH